MKSSSAGKLGGRAPARRRAAAYRSAGLVMTTRLRAYRLRTRRRRRVTGRRRYRCTACRRCRAVPPDRRRTTVPAASARPGRGGAVRLPRHARPGGGPGGLGARRRRGLRRRRWTAAGRPSLADRLVTAGPGRRAAAPPGAAAPGRALGRPGPVRAQPTGPPTPAWPRRWTPTWRGWPTPSTTGCCGPEGWLPYADTGADPAGAARGRRSRSAVVSNIGFDIRADLRAWASRPVRRRLRAVVRGGPLQAGPGDLPARLRAARRRPGADADGRRHPGRRGRGRGRLRARWCCPPPPAAPQRPRRRARPGPRRPVTPPPIVAPWTPWPRGLRGPRGPGGSRADAGELISIHRHMTLIHGVGGAVVGGSGAGERAGTIRGGHGRP